MLFTMPMAKYPNLPEECTASATLSTEKEVEIKRALSLFRIHTEIGDDPAAVKNSPKISKTFPFEVIGKKKIL